MLENITDDLKQSSYASLSRTFSRLGWTGFWTQVVIGAMPALLMTYLFFFSGSPSGPRAGFRLVEFMTLASLAMLVFTTLWSYRYTRLAKRIPDPEMRPTDNALSNITWTGIFASTVGILISILVMLIEVAHLLFYFLSMPQAGVPVIQTGELSFVSSVDMLSLMALTFTLLAEVIVLVFSLWLLFRVTIVSARTGESTTDESPHVESTTGDEIAT
ncbi:MAG: DUF3611 family protein [Planctomycetota bacterium]|nr:DUF3611 family protein [Planctomycetota bacterium]